MWKAIVWKSQYDSKRIGHKTQAAGTHVITIKRAIRKASPSGETSFVVRHGLCRSVLTGLAMLRVTLKERNKKSIREDTKKKGPGWN